MFHKPFIRNLWLGRLQRLGCVLLCSSFFVLPCHAQKTDEVYLINGDRITGDVKGLERGQLLIKTTSMGSIYVDWTAVSQVVSDKPLQLELIDGRRVLGSLNPGGDEKIDVSTVFGDVETLPVDTVVRLDPVHIDRNFWQRLNGKVGLGLSYTKGSEVGQFYFLGNAKYREVDSEYEVKWDSILTSNGNGPDAKRGNVGGTYRRYLEDRNFWTLLSTIDRNDELGISSRFSGGGGAGKLLLQTRDYQLAIVGGAVATQENTGDADEDDTNVESIFIADFGLYRFNTPKTQLRSTLTVWPSITDWGRVRSNFDVSLGQEIFNDDISISLTAYASHDNKPPSDAANGDFGIVTSLDFTF